MAGLSLMSRAFNGIDDDKDGINLAELAADAMIKIKTRTYAAARHIADQ